MKRIVYVIPFLFLGVCAHAQVTGDVKIRYELNGAIASKLEKPYYFDEPGIVVVHIVVSKEGMVTDGQIQENESTINGYPLNGARRAALASSFSVYNSSADTLKGKIIYEFFKYTQAQVDSVQTEALKSLEESVSGLKDNVMNQYYELYPTENMWTFLELDTCFGSIRQVQYTVKDDDNYRFKLSISSDDLRESGFSLYRDKIIPGRFALYKTQNMYNFILLDKVDGRTWQVQWGMDAKDRQIIPIK